MDFTIYAPKTIALIRCAVTALTEETHAALKQSLIGCWEGNGSNNYTGSILVLNLLDSVSEYLVGSSVRKMTLLFVNESLRLTNKSLFFGTARSSNSVGRVSVSALQWQFDFHSAQSFTETCYLHFRSTANSRRVVSRLLLGLNNVLFCLRFFVPVNTFSAILGRLPGFNQY